MNLLLFKRFCMHFCVEKRRRKRLLKYVCYKIQTYYVKSILNKGITNWISISSSEVEMTAFLAESCDVRLPLILPPPRQFPPPLPRQFPPPRPLQFPLPPRPQDFLPPPLADIFGL